MTGLIKDQIRGFATLLADLKVRVRVALAGELAGHVAAAVRDVVHAVVAGRADVPRVAGRGDPPGRAWHADRDPWDDDPRYGRYDDDPEVFVRRVAPDGAAPSPAVPVTVVAGLHVARWWLARRGGLAGAVGCAAGVGLLGLVGGPAVRAAVAAVAAAADLLAVTDTLGTAADRLRHS